MRSATFAGMRAPVALSSAQVILEQLVELLLAQGLGEKSGSHRVLHGVIQTGEARKREIVSRIELVAGNPCLLLRNARHLRELSDGFVALIHPVEGLRVCPQRTFDQFVSAREEIQV